MHLGHQGSEMAKELPMSFMNLSYFCRFKKQRKNADNAELFLFLAYIPRIFDKPSLLNV